MADLLPQFTGWLDSRKEALKRGVMDALQNPDDFISRLTSDANDYNKQSKAAFDASRSAVPAVREMGTQAIISDPVTGVGGFGGGAGSIMRAERMALGGHIPQQQVHKLIGDVHQMRAEGESPEAIWQYTNQMLKGTPYNGMAFLPSGELVTELSDAGAKARPAAIAPNSQGSFPLLPEALDHPELLKHNPALGKVEVNSVIDASKPEDGAFIPGKFPAGNDPHFIHSQAPDEDTARKILLHEANHVIQETDGLPTGGNWKEEFARLMDAGAEPTAATQEQAVKNYGDLLGEVISRVVEGRRNLVNATAQNKPLNTSVDYLLQGRQPLVRYSGQK